MTQQQMINMIEALDPKIKENVKFKISIGKAEEALVLILANTK